MKTPSSITNILSKEMDRKEFLQHVAAMGLFVSGAGVLLNSLGAFGKLQNGQASQLAQSDNTSYGYGASSYGGNKNPLVQ